jgi:hypothetical protein
MNRGRFFSRDTLSLLLVILLQVFFLRLSSLLLASLSCGTLLLLSLIASRRRRGIIAVFGSMAVITVPVLVIRLVAGSGDTRLQELAIWLVYYLRLVSAALTARLLVLIVGTSGVQRGFVGLVSFLPGKLPGIIGVLVGSSLFLVPVVLVHIRRTFQISRIRYRGGSVGTVRRILQILHVTFAALSTLPAQRAEGMVIRGIME